MRQGSREAEVKGIWFTSKGRAEFLAEERPRIGPDTMLLRTLYSGLSNGTERNKMLGGNYHKGTYPDRIGYQHVSEVVECGERITLFRPGDIVFTATFPGHVPFHLARESDLIVPIPEGFDRVAACMMGVASVSMHDARLAQVSVADRVLVTGAGLIGLFAVQASHLLGADVTVMDRHEDRLRLAAELGAARVVDNTNDRGWLLLKDNAPFDVCLECAGGDFIDRIVGAGRDRPGILARPSRMVFVAGRDKVTIDFNAAFRCRLSTYFTGHFLQGDLEQVLRLARSRRLKLAEVVRDVVPIRDALAVYDRLRDEKSRLLGTVFDWTGDHGLD
jgi:threonine dehydrogenase-like Zn-dependent dehydrogenase